MCTAGPLRGSRYSLRVADVHTRPGRVLPLSLARHLALAPVPAPVPAPCYVAGMELETGTAGIVMLAWSRLLGLKDTALADARGERLYCVDDTAKALTFIRLFGQEVLSGPVWAANAADRLSGEELAQHSTLVRLSRDHGGHGLGEARLFFSDVVPTLGEPGPATPSLEIPPDIAISTDNAHAHALEAACPPDDASEAALAQCEQHWIMTATNGTLGDDALRLSREEEPRVSNDGGPSPVAGAGYDIWAGILAHLTVLTAPEFRRRGYSRRISAIAVEDALAAGLVPQWRARTDNTASHKTAVGLGFVESGIQTSVLLPPAIA